MKRREFIAALGSAAAWPLVARAQQAPTPVIGYFSSRSPDAEGPLRVPFLKALAEAGFAPGRNIAILIEVASRNFLLRAQGYNASKQLAEKINEIAAGKPE